MGREHWWATVNGATRIEQDLVTKPPPSFIKQVNKDLLYSTHIYSKILWENQPSKY